MTAGAVDLHTQPSPLHRPIALNRYRPPPQVALNPLERTTLPEGKPHRDSWRGGAPCYPWLYFDVMVSTNTITLSLADALLYPTNSAWTRMAMAANCDVDGGI